MQKRFFCVFLAVLFLFSACKSGSADDRAKAAREDAVRDQDGVLHYWEDPSLAETSRMNGNYTEEVFDRALAERIRQYLDEEGAPILEQTPGMVKTIVAEELSALRAGHGSAEDCAAKIQSRVSIWLAERK